MIEILVKIGLLTFFVFIVYALWTGLDEMNYYHLRIFNDKHEEIYYEKHTIPRVLYKKGEEIVKNDPSKYYSVDTR